MSINRWSCFSLLCDLGVRGSPFPGMKTDPLQWSNDILLLVGQERHAAQAAIETNSAVWDPAWTLRTRGRLSRPEPSQTARGWWTGGAGTQEVGIPGFQFSHRTLSDGKLLLGCYGTGTLAFGVVLQQPIAVPRLGWLACFNIAEEEESRVRYHVSIISFHPTQFFRQNYTLLNRKESFLTFLSIIDKSINFMKT